MMSRGLKKKKERKENLVKSHAKESTCQGSKDPKGASKHQGEPEEPPASQGAEGETPNRTHQHGTAAHPTL